MEAIVDALAAKVLTHEVEYRIGNGPWRTIRVQGSYEDIDINSGLSGVIQQQTELMISKNDVPAEPSPSDRLKLPKLGAGVWQPRDVRNETDGRHWLIGVKKAPA